MIQPTDRVEVVARRLDLRGRADLIESGSDGFTQCDIADNDEPPAPASGAALGSGRFAAFSRLLSGGGLSRERRCIL
jgi:hypothetical protein